MRKITTFAMFLILIGGATKPAVATSPVAGNNQWQEMNQYQSMDQSLKNDISVTATSAGGQGGQGGAGGQGGQGGSVKDSGNSTNILGQSIKDSGNSASLSSSKAESDSQSSVKDSGNSTVSIKNPKTPPPLNQTQPIIINIPNSQLHALEEAQRYAKASRQLVKIQFYGPKDTYEANGVRLEIFKGKYFENFKKTGKNDVENSVIEGQVPSEQLAVIKARPSGGSKDVEVEDYSLTVKQYLDKEYSGLTAVNVADLNLETIEFNGKGRGASASPSISGVNPAGDVVGAFTAILTGTSSRNFESIYIREGFILTRSVK